jgi:aminoglycoside phosphotransferase (APT) family kinase protein
LTPQQQNPPDSQSSDLAASVARFLQRRGLIPPDTNIAVRALEGGVSGEVVEVTCGDRRFVVKRPRSKLAVTHEWFADDTRIIAETDALRLAGSIVPDGVPPVVDLDEATKTLVMERAQDNWHNWRDELLAGRVDTEVGSRLGEMFSRWHRHAGHPEPTPRLANTDRFVQLRIDPFHREIAKRHPELAPRIEQVADLLLTRKTALVHGDFSPKNVLVGDGRQWVLDWEVSHVGDPVFDLAFLTTHLILKALHRPNRGSSYRSVFNAFAESYGDMGRPEDLAVNVGCLLLARVDGKSPAHYLTPAQQARARNVGSTLLDDPHSGVTLVWETVT